jgi:hypothetical protein
MLRGGELRFVKLQLLTVSAVSARIARPVTPQHGTCDTAA